MEFDLPYYLTAFLVAMSGGFVLALREGLELSFTLMAIAFYCREVKVDLAPIVYAALVGAALSFSVLWGIEIALANIDAFWVRPAVMAMSAFVFIDIAWGFYKRESKYKFRTAAIAYTWAGYATLRELTEINLFGAVLVAANPAHIAQIIGSIIYGLVVAICVGLLVWAYGKKLPTRLMFVVSSLVLAALAAFTLIKAIMGDLPVRYLAPYGVTDPNAPYFTGDPSIGRQGSIPPAKSFEHPQREIVNFETKAGFAPVDTDLYQLLKAIRSQRVNYVIDVGPTNHLACAFDPPLDEYTNGLIVRIKAGHTNNGPADINCGPGVAPIVRLNGSPLSPADIMVGGVAALIYVDNEFQLINPNIFAAVKLAIGGVTGAPIPPPVTGAESYVVNNYGGVSAIIAWEKAGTYDWPVPAGVQKIWLRLWGGGGPGVEYDQDGKFIKGGDGGYVEGIFAVVPGNLMRIVIGAGAAPPVSARTGNVSYNSLTWKNTRGGQSSFGIAGQTALCSCTGGRGPYPNPPGDTDPSPGEPGVGTGGTMSRANRLYGCGGGGFQTSDGYYDDWIEDKGDDGAAIIVF